MATLNNLHVPDELLNQARRLAASQGRTADDLAADALKRYLAHEWLSALETEGDAHRKRLGLKSDEDVAIYVGQLISDVRKQRHLR